ncbi:MAG: hypothetical protein AAF740_08970 [Bacteroidota bacterium]
MSKQVTIAKKEIYVSGANMHMTAEMTAKEMQYVNFRNGTTIAEKLKEENGKAEIIMLLTQELAVSKFKNGVDILKGIDEEFKLQARKAIVNSLFAVLIDYQTLTVLELADILNKGLTGGLTEYKNLNAANFKAWIETYKHSKERFQAIKKHEALTTPEKPKETVWHQLAKSLDQFWEVVVELRERDHLPSETLKQLAFDRIRKRVSFKMVLRLSLQKYRLLEVSDQRIKQLMDEYVHKESKSEDDEATPMREVIEALAKSSFAKSRIDSYVNAKLLSKYAYSISFDRKEDAKIGAFFHRIVKPKL